MLHARSNQKRFQIIKIHLCNHYDFCFVSLVGVAFLGGSACTMPWGGMSSAGLPDGAVIGYWTRTWGPLYYTYVHLHSIRNQREAHFSPRLCMLPIAGVSFFARKYPKPTNGRHICDVSYIYIYIQRERVIYVYIS